MLRLEVRIDRKLASSVLVDPSQQRIKRIPNAIRSTRNPPNRNRQRMLGLRLVVATGRDGKTEWQHSQYMVHAHYANRAMKERKLNTTNKTIETVTNKAKIKVLYISFVLLLADWQGEWGWHQFWPLLVRVGFANEEFLCFANSWLGMFWTKFITIRYKGRCSCKAGAQRCYRDPNAGKWWTYATTYRTWTPKWDSRK